jgi:DNA-binding NarL/FixJ family response regulator
VDNGRDAVRLAGLLKPDLVLMDLAMPQMDGMSAIRELRRRVSDAKVKILVLTMHKTEEHIRAALQAGANGYVLKDASRAELLMAIHSVMGGKTFISPAVAERIVTGYLDRGESEVRPLSDTLTAREKQVLKLIAEGGRNRDIAEYLFVSVKTVEKHRANLMGKLNLHNTAALTSFAIHNALVSR